MLGDSRESRRRSGCRAPASAAQRRRIPGQLLAQRNGPRAPGLAKGRSRNATTTASVKVSPVRAASSRASRSASGSLILSAMVLILDKMLHSRQPLSIPDKAGRTVTSTHRRVPPRNLPADIGPSAGRRGCDRYEFPGCDVARCQQRRSSFVRCQHQALQFTLSGMPTIHRRHAVTETEDIAAALEVARNAWPELADKPGALLRQLILAGEQALEARRSRAVEGRRQTIERTAGALTGVYRSGIWRKFARTGPSDHPGRQRPHRASGD